MTAGVAANRGALIMGRMNDAKSKSYAAKRAA